MDVYRDRFMNSLSPAASKIWLCERLVGIDGCRIERIGDTELLAAAKDLPKLRIPRWSKAKNPKSGEVGEGLRAPLPCVENSWLDLKGGFLDASGTASQIKSQDRRAFQIHNFGWT